MNCKPSNRILKKYRFYDTSTYSSSMVYAILVTDMLLLCKH